MEYIFIVISLSAAVHAFSYGRWLMKNGNRFGGYVVYTVVILCLILPVYNIAKAH